MINDENNYNGAELTNIGLWHYGILGMKWGVRRFQNKDGSLTEAGKKRYLQLKYSAKTDERLGNDKRAAKIRNDVIYKRGKREEAKEAKFQSSLSEQSNSNNEKFSKNPNDVSEIQRMRFKNIDLMPEEHEFMAKINKMSYEDRNKEYENFREEHRLKFTDKERSQAVIDTNLLSSIGPDIMWEHQEADVKGETPKRSYEASYYAYNLAGILGSYYGLRYNNNDRTKYVKRHKSYAEEIEITKRYDELYNDIEEQVKRTFEE